MTALVIQTQGTLAHLRTRAFLKIPFLNKNFTYLATLHNEFQGRLKSCLYSFAHSKSLNLKRCYMKKGRGANVRCKSIAAKLTTASWGVLIGVNSTTGCDNITAFFGKGRWKTVQLWRVSRERVISIQWELQIQDTEAPVCALYGKKWHSVDVLVLTMRFIPRKDI